MEHDFPTQSSAANHHHHHPHHHLSLSPSPSPTLDAVSDEIESDLASSPWLSWHGSYEPIPMFSLEVNWFRLPLAALLPGLSDLLNRDICREIKQMLWQPLTDRTIHQAVRAWYDEATQRNT
eukprot:gene13631-15808_t